MSKSTGSEETEVKPGLRVNIDGQWFTVSTKLEKPDTWELIGYYIPAGMRTAGKKLVLRKTSDEIREYAGNYLADQVLREGFQLPALKKPERKSRRMKQFFVQKILTMRENAKYTVLST